jgi:Dyp-type peroxidase family
MSVPPLDLADIQGLVTYGYRQLPLARIVLLRARDASGTRSWLATLAGRVTNATADPTETAVNVALTATGIHRLGAPAPALAMLSDPFRDGMAEPHRARMLGDVGGSDPGQWTWGGPGLPAVDLLLLLYASTAATLADLANRESSTCRAHGLSEIRAIDTVDLGRREHFGFPDGISQPAIEGLPGKRRPDDVIKAGEFVLGYPNEYGRYTDRPLLDADADPSSVLPVDAAGSGRPDLGRNGTYLVVRQLMQDVSGFWQFCEEATRRLDGGADETPRDWLAAKIVGRWPGGAPLTLAPVADDPSLADANDFRYEQLDAGGLRCPTGAHVRRSNPRDSLDPRPGSDASVAVGKRHRIIRRGRSYGAPDGRAERGLIFMCVCANLSRQYEFVQASWVGNAKFDGLYDDADPLVGAHHPNGAMFTVPALPVRRRFAGLPRFVTVRGGAYFFLPGLRALRYLAGLGGEF